MRAVLFHEDSQGPRCPAAPPATEPSPSCMIRCGPRHTVLQLVGRAGAPWEIRLFSKISLFLDLPPQRGVDFLSPVPGVDLKKHPEFLFDFLGACDLKHEQNLPPVAGFSGAWVLEWNMWNRPELVPWLGTQQLHRAHEQDINNTHVYLPLNFGVVLCSIVAAKANWYNVWTESKSNFLLNKQSAHKNSISHILFILWPHLAAREAGRQKLIDPVPSLKEDIQMAIST